MERRALERFDLNLPAVVEIPGRESLRLTTVDVSSGGAFFLSDRPIPERTEVTVELGLEVGELWRMRGDGRIPLRLSGRVLRSGAGGLAVAFEEPCGRHVR